MPNLPVARTLFVVTAVASAGLPAVRLDVPFVAQEDRNGCGAAVIAMVMRYWRVESGDVQAIHRTLYSPQDRGVHASAMQRYFGLHGFRSYGFKGDWQDVENHLRKGRPVIVALQAGRDSLHYVVVTGYEPAANLVLKHDPAVRKLVRQRRTEFERQWKAAGNWTLLALPEVTQAAAAR
jgi:ABC-type bacteriocin/lantibiotic exporter with double-glycine peptidase domain